MRSKVFVAGHNLGKLCAIGEECEAVVIATEDDNAAVVEISATDDVKVIFGHLNKDAWTLLRSKCNRQDILVRLTTSILDGQSSVPSGEEALFLQCQKCLSDLMAEDLRTLIWALGDSSIVARLRSGEVPIELRRFFSFQQANYTIALAILATGALHAPADKREATTKPEWWKTILGRNIPDLKNQIRKEHGLPDDVALAKFFPATAALLDAGFELPSEEKARLALVELVVTECSKLS